MGKKILIGFLVFALVTWSLALFTWSFGSRSFKKTSQFKMVMREIVHDARILQETGGVIDIEDYGGDIRQDSARINVTLKAEKKLILASYHLATSDTSSRIVKMEMFKKNAGSDQWIAMPKN
jgi:hypothetical protein